MKGVKDERRNIRFYGTVTNVSLKKVESINSTSLINFDFIICKDNINILLISEI